MRRLALIVLAFALALPGAAAAQTWGQPYYGVQPAPYGQPWGGPVASGYGGFGQSYGYDYGDPRAYRPPVWSGHGQSYGRGHDRGGRYGYSNRSGQWTRWSSPPGRGYHDVYGYNDDRSPRGADHGRDPDRDCHCGVGPRLYDR